MSKVTKSELMIVFQMATKNYVNMPSHNVSLDTSFKELDDQERRALAFLNASLTFLNKRKILVEDWETKIDTNLIQIETDVIGE